MAFVLPILNKASTAGNLTNAVIAGEGGYINNDVASNTSADGDENLKKGKASQTGGTTNTAENAAGADGEINPWSSLAKSNRDPVSPVNRIGLDTEDRRTGRLLTLFERTSRAIRSDHDRDFILAKIEWTRKDLLRKKNLKRTRDPDIAAITAP